MMKRNNGGMSVGRRKGEERWMRGEEVEEATEGRKLRVHLWCLCTVIILQTQILIWSSGKDWSLTSLSIWLSCGIIRFTDSEFCRRTSKTSDILHWCKPPACVCVRGLMCISISTSFYIAVPICVHNSTCVQYKQLIFTITVTIQPVKKQETNKQKTEHTKLWPCVFPVSCFLTAYLLAVPPLLLVPGSILRPPQHLRAQSIFHFACGSGSRFLCMTL